MCKFCIYLYFYYARKSLSTLAEIGEKWYTSMICNVLVTDVGKKKLNFSTVILSAAYTGTNNYSFAKRSGCVQVITMR